jgi:hypothetical protein
MLDALERSIGRILTPHDKDEIRSAQQRAYRWTFLVSVWNTRGSPRS